MTLKSIWRSFQPRLSFPRPLQQSLACFRVARSPSNSWASCYFSKPPDTNKIKMIILNTFVSTDDLYKSWNKSPPPINDATRLHDTSVCLINIMQLLYMCIYWCSHHSVNTDGMMARLLLLLQLQVGLPDVQTLQAPASTHQVIHLHKLAVSDTQWWRQNNGGSRQKMFTAVPEIRLIL